MTQRSKKQRPASRDMRKLSDQSQAFIEAARKLGCDEDPAHFDEVLKKVARHKSPPNAPHGSNERKTKNSC